MLSLLWLDGIGSKVDEEGMEGLMLMVSTMYPQDRPFEFNCMNLKYGDDFFRFLG